MDSVGRLAQRLGRRWAGLIACGFLVACGGGEPEPGENGVHLDRWVAAFDAASPSALVLDGGGSLVLDRGWTPEHRVDHLGSSDRRVWAIGGSSRVRFVKPQGLVDLWIDAMAFPPGASDTPQRITVRLGDEVVARATLRSDAWEEVRIPLPDGLVTGRLYELILDFERTTLPRDFYGEGGDERPLAAEVTGIAVVPRGLVEPRKFLAAAGWTERDGLRLPLGGELALPVPGPGHGTVRWGRVRGARRATLQVVVRAPDGQEELLWSESVDESSDRQLEWRSTEPGSRLVFSAQGAAERFVPDQVVTVDLPPDFLATTSSHRAPSSPHVFVYLVDTLRADSLGPYGAAAAHTPALDAFASEGVVYERAQAASAWTLPSVVSLLTGTYADRHGVMKGFEKLGAVEPLASRLERNGYDTVAFSQSFIASEAFGVDRGFGEFWLHDQLNDFGQASPLLRRMFLEWFRSRDDERPLFAYLHSVDPHSPYAPIPPYDALAREHPGSLDPKDYGPGFFNRDRRAGETKEIAHLRGLYEGEVRYTDAQFGRFLDLLRRLGLYDDSLIVFVSDHGEEFGDHGAFDHGRTLYREMIEVPLIIRFPRGQWSGERVESPVSLVDLAPTVYELAGIETPPGTFDGRSLTEVLGQPTGPARVVFSQVNPEAGPFAGTVDYQALIGPAMKCIENRLGVDQFGEEQPTWLAFDLTVDAAERIPLPVEASKAERCRRTLERWQERRALDAAQSSPGELVSDEAIDTLRALGYIQ